MRTRFKVQSLPSVEILHSAMHYSLILLLSVVTVLFEVIKPVDGSDVWRLPKNIIPKHYDLYVEAKGFSEFDKFNGIVEIDFMDVEATAEIVLHSQFLEINKVTLYDARKNRLKDPTVTLAGQVSHPLMLLNCQSVLEVGNYSMRVEFTGQLYHAMVESYQDSKGSKKFYVVTQFEPTYARKVFPCFDEPALKATFNLRVVHHKSQTADSNMPLDGPPQPLTGNEEMVVSKFQRTPKMSTYLLAWTVSEFIQLDDSNHTTKAREEVLNGTIPSLGVAKELLNVLDAHTSLPYQNYLPKLTHYEVPIAYSWWKAKENWGLITYAESSLLLNPSIYDSQEQATTLRTIAHELAHMWFGNLVTPEWWDYLWMKEGFATLYTYYGMDMIRPEQQWMEWFVVEAVPKGRTKKFLNDSITAECRYESSIRANYRPANFERAAGVLNMFREVVGDEDWQRIVRVFLKRHQLDSVVPNDLYQAVADVVNGTGKFPTNKTVQETMDSWMTEVGTPILFVERMYNESKIRIRQYEMDSNFEGNGSKWIIPYDYASESSTDFERIGPVDWLTEQTTIIDTEVPANEWIVFNKRQLAPCLILYDVQNWKLISQALRSNISSVHRLNRAQLLSDAFYSYEHGHLDQGTFFELITFLENETESLVWFVAEPILQHIEGMTKGLKYRGYFKTFLRQLTRRYFDYIASNPVTFELDQSVRASISWWACRAGNEACLNVAATSFSKACRAKDTSLILPDDVARVYCFGLTQNSSNDDEFRRVLDQLKAPNLNRRQRLRLVKALGCTQRADRLREVLQTVHDTAVRFRDQSSEIVGKFREGFNSDLGEGQFWALEALMMDTELMDSFREIFVYELIWALDNRLQSEAGMDVLEKLGKLYQPTLYRIFHWYDPRSYEPEWEHRDYALNSVLEDFVEHRVGRD